MDNSDGTFESANRIYDSNGIAPAMVTSAGGGHTPKIVALRGRNPENPSDRTTGVDLEQRLEINHDDIANALTTVAKDCMVMKYDDAVELFAIRRLTPRETWRFMDCTDEDFDKAAEVVSETRLYQGSGDAIVVSVLMAIFSQLNIQGITPWNDLTEDERYAMIEK